MPIIDKIPENLLTSSSGNATAMAAALVAGFVASKYGATDAQTHASMLLAAAVVLYLFPQRAAPLSAQSAATLAAASAVAAAPAAATAAAAGAPPPPLDVDGALDVLERTISGGRQAEAKLTALTIKPHPP